MYMRTSYTDPVNFGDIIRAVTFVVAPRDIMEIGILDGFSLSVFCESRPSGAIVEGYDIFDDFCGNHASFDHLQDKFAGVSGCSIVRGDFYEVFKKKANRSIDIIHIDIANDGDIFRFAFNNYMPKLREGGALLLEGGSEQRDQVDWMIRYSKPPINPVVRELSSYYDIQIIGNMPSLTIAKRKGV